MVDLKTKTEAAQALRCSLRTVDYLIAQGKLRIVRLGRLVRIEASELERLVAECKAA